MNKEVDSRVCVRKLVKNKYWFPFVQQHDPQAEFKVDQMNFK